MVDGPFSMTLPSRSVHSLRRDVLDRFMMFKEMFKEFSYIIVVVLENDIMTAALEKRSYFIVDS